MINPSDADDVLYTIVPQVNIPLILPTHYKNQSLHDYIYKKLNQVQEIQYTIQDEDLHQYQDNKTSTLDLEYSQSNVARSQQFKRTDSKKSLIKSIFEFINPFNNENSVMQSQQGLIVSDDNKSQRKDDIQRKDSNKSQQNDGNQRTSSDSSFSKQLRINEKQQAALDISAISNDQQYSIDSGRSNPFQSVHNNSLNKSQAIPQIAARRNSDIIGTDSSGNSIPNIVQNSILNRVSNVPRLTGFDQFRLLDNQPAVRDTMVSNSQVSQSGNSSDLGERDPNGFSQIQRNPRIQNNRYQNVQDDDQSQISDINDQLSNHNLLNTISDINVLDSPRNADQMQFSIPGNPHTINKQQVSIQQYNPINPQSFKMNSGEMQYPRPPNPYDRNMIPQDPQQRPEALQQRPQRKGWFDFLRR